MGRIRRHSWWALAVWVALSPGCSGNRLGEHDDKFGAGAHQVPLDNSLADVPDVDPRVAPFVGAVVAANPTAPRGPTGASLSFTAAPELRGLMVQVARDSAILQLPVVAGAQDFRAYSLASNLRVAPSGSGQSVAGAEVTCAGVRQFNAPPPASPIVVQTLEIENLQGPTDVVVEALDSPCPFAGIVGTTHYSTRVTGTEVPAQDRVPQTIYTRAEIEAVYGSLILNGHGAGSTLAAPASPTTPTVLARTTITITPTGRAVPELAYFDDFANDAVQPVFVRNLATYGDRNSNARLLQTGRWNVYQTNFDYAEARISRGALQTTVLDRYQQTFATQFMVPRRPVRLTDDSYVHVSFTTGTDATQRRYWWMFLCGSEAEDKTIDDDGRIAGNIVNTPFFYQADGRNPSIDKWNCLQIFPRDGVPFKLGPTNDRPQSDVRVMINVPNGPERGSVVNVSPNQFATQGGSSVVSPGWFRQQSGAGNLTGVMLDDQLVIAPRTRYDVYVSRTRVIMLVNGEQRLCNDFKRQRLTMAEAALGLGQVLYHSTAERLEFSQSFNDRTGQRYYLTNTPYADVRSWDNMGYMEFTRAPTTFDASACYEY